MSCIRAARGWRASCTRCATCRSTSPEGEFIGIVGRNGSGKSTLLKCLAGIYPPDRGTIAVAGRVSPFIELGVGFNPELTARDNVVVNAALLGMSRSEALARFPAIIEFAELERFVDLKLKNYSSGMQVRLGFASMIQTEADLYLVDEVLAVGDSRFQQKCFDTFRRLKRDRRTVVFVTHDLATVERFCDRAILLEGGEVVADGETREVMHIYRQRDIEEEQAVHGEPVSRAPASGDGTARVVEAWFEDAEGQPPDGAAAGAAGDLSGSGAVRGADGEPRLRRDPEGRERRPCVRHEHDAGRHPDGRLRGRARRPCTR